MKINKDFIAFKSKSLKKSNIAVILNPCFQGVFLYRISNYLYLKNLGILSKLITLFSRIVYSIDIDYRAEIDEGFFIAHGIGIVIGHKVSIGKNCSIYQGVTLGGNLNKEKKYNGRIITQPVLLDNVSVYSNSIIIGPVVIGENTTIGAMTLVTNDIPANSIVYCKQSLNMNSK